MPYAKYLDCGADMFHEIITTHWLTAATGDRYSSDSNAAKRPPAGLVIRLQGFDRGVFGGNFHTHNSLPLPPGLDVVVFSNGGDWVKGWRHALAAAKQVTEIGTDQYRSPYGSQSKLIYHCELFSLHVSCSFYPICSSPVHTGLSHRSGKRGAWYWSWIQRIS